MKNYPNVRRWLSAFATLAVFALVLAVVVWSSRSREADQVLANQAKTEAGHGWFMFGGSVQRNMVNPFETDIATDWSTEAGSMQHIKWVANLGSKAYGGPSIAGGKIFVGTNNENPRNPRDRDKSGAPIDKGVVMCFRESDGQLLWQAVHDKLPAGRVNDWPREGICSTPYVEGNRLYYVNNRCEVICADTEGFLDGTNDGVQDELYQTKTDADIIWRLDMIKELNVFPHNLANCSPLIVGDILYVITSNGVDEGHINIPQPKAPSFLAIDKHTGKVLWQDNSPDGKIMHGQWSNPVYAEIKGRPEIIFPGGDGLLRGFEPTTGKLIWKFDCNLKTSVYKLGGKGTRSDFLATPVVYDNKVYIGLGQDPEHDEGVGHLWCIDPSKATPDNVDLSPVNDNLDPKADVNKNSGLVWHYGGPAPADADRNYLFGRTLSTCAIHDGLVYAAELAGYIHCLDAQTGQVYWEHNMNTQTWTSPSWVDGKVYMGSDDGVVRIFAQGKEKKLLGEVSMGEDTRIRATPVAVNGVLYVMTENKLYAIK